jgi:hypothetical protein
MSFFVLLYCDNKFDTYLLDFLLRDLLPFGGSGAFAEVVDWLAFKEAPPALVAAASCLLTEPWAPLTWTLLFLFGRNSTSPSWAAISQDLGVALGSLDQSALDI